MEIIEIKQIPVILVEFSEVVDNLQIFNDIGRPYLSYYTKPVNTHRAYLPDGDYVVLGYLSDLTEEQFAECVGEPHFVQIFSKRMGPLYTDYTNQGRSMVSAKCSWDTLLESENVYIENPYVEKPEPCGCTGPCGIPCAFNEWQEAQSRTIDPKRTVVLLRKESKK